MARAVAARALAARTRRPLVEVPWGEPGWESVDPDRARAAYAELAGRTINQARKRSVELLEESGDLVGEPEQITRAVKFFEKGERPVEIVTPAVVHPHDRAS